MSPSLMQDVKMLELPGFFKEICESSYCIVKMSDKFPLYSPGEDVDIFCYSLDEVVKKLLHWGDRQVDRGFRIKVTSVVKKKHVHVDFLRKSVLQFRFDLYAELPVYTKVLIKPALFESVIENSRVAAFSASPEDVQVKIPSEIDDALIRYLEFMEWYDVRPDKLKHLDYIMDNLGEAARSRFLEKMHHYTAMPPVCVPEQANAGFLGHVARLLKKCFP